MSCSIYEPYPDKFKAQYRVLCKCGHSILVYKRERREVCSNCGRMVFLTKKDEFMYKMKRRVIK